MEQAAREILRALRGKRSQVAFSRWLGYRGNVAAKWESGKRFPAFGEALRAAARVGVDVPRALEGFHPASAELWNPDEPTALAAWLSGMLGSTQQNLIAERAGLSRQQVGRLLSGKSRGRMPEVMLLLDAMTGRLPDLVAKLVDIDQVPSMSRQAKVRHALARMAFTHPWSSAAQSWFGVRESVPRSTAAKELAEALGLEPDYAHELLEALLEAQMLQVVRGQVRRGPPTTVEVDASAADIQELRAHWARVAADRLSEGAPNDLFSFNVFAASKEDVEKIRQAQRRFYREVRAIVAESPPEVVVLLTAQTGVLGS